MKILGLIAATLAAGILVWSVVAALVEPEPLRDTYGNTVSDECTEDDLTDGVCLTYDDIRNQPVHSGK